MLLMDQQEAETESQNNLTKVKNKSSKIFT